jgi:hypothetical protein
MPPPWRQHPVRVVSVSSSANMMAPVFFDDPNFNFIPYNPWLAYGQSKTANVLLAVEATRPGPTQAFSQML